MGKFIKLDIIILAILFLVISVFTLRVQAAQTPSSPYSISGYVFNDVNRDGLREKGDNGSASILVNVKDTKGKWSIVKTDTNGLYIYPVSQTGIYTISVTLPPGKILTSVPNDSTYYVGSDNKKVTANFGIASLTSRSTNVSLDQAGNCTVQSSYQSCANEGCVWDSDRCIYSNSLPSLSACQWDWSCQSGSCSAGNTGGSGTCITPTQGCPDPAGITTQYSCSFCSTSTSCSQAGCAASQCSLPTGGGTSSSRCAVFGGVAGCSNWCAQNGGGTCTAADDCLICHQSTTTPGGACQSGYTPSNGQCCPIGSPYYCSATGFCYVNAGACTAATGGTTGTTTGGGSCNDQDNYFDCADTSEGGVPCVYDEAPRNNQGSPYVCFKEKTQTQGTACTYNQTCTTNLCVNSATQGYSVCSTTSGGGGGTTGNLQVQTLPTTPPEGTVGQSYSGISLWMFDPDNNQFLSGNEINVSLSSGQLPPGLTVHLTGGTAGYIIDGTPTTAGTYSFNLTLCKTGTTVCRFAALSIIIHSSGGGGTGDLQLQLLPSTPPDGTVNKPYGGVNIWMFDPSNNQYLSGNQLTVTTTAGNLPPGITHHIAANGNGYIIDGTPTSTGIYVFWLRICKTGTTICKDANLTIVVNSTGGNTTDNLTLTLSPTTPPNGKVGTPYSPVQINVFSKALNRVLSSQELTWSNPNYPANTYPAGITFNQANSTFSGTPTQAGSFLVLQKACSTVTQECGSVQFSLTIDPAGGTGTGTVTVLFTQPTEGSSIGSVTSIRVQATTTTPQGTIKSIKVCVDDLNGNDCATIPASGLTVFGNVAQGEVQLDPSDETNGPHKLLALATDSANKTGQNQINITIKNGIGPTPTPTKTGPTPTPVGPTSTPGGPTATPGGNNPTATPTGTGNTPTPSPTAVPACNKACSSTSACPDGYSCLNNVCRANACLADNTCSCVAPTATPTGTGNTPTPSPTLPAGVTPTPSPTLPAGVTPTTSPTPTLTVTPSPIPATPVKVSVTLPGIGDRSGDNQEPKHTTRDAEVFIYDSKGTQVAHGEGTVTYTDGVFTGTVSVPGLPTGTYTVKVKLNNTLQGQVSSKPISITSGQTVTLPSLELVSGDFNNDNQLGLSDYNIIISCFGNKLCSRKQDADLNDDGQVEEKDLNILIRGFALQL